MKNTYILAILFCCHFYFVFPQHPNNEDDKKKIEIENLIRLSSDDSLTTSQKQNSLIQAYAKLQELKNDSLKLQLLSNLSYYINFNESTFFKKVNRETLRLSQALNDSTVLAQAYWDLGYFYARNAVKDSAYYSYSEAQKIYEAQKDFYRSGRMLYNMAKHQQEIRDYIGSEVNTIAAIERLKPLNKNRELYNSYNTLAIISQALGEYEQALKYYDEALFYLKKTDFDKASIRQNTNNRAMVFKDMGQYSNALVAFEENLLDTTLKSSKIEVYAKTLSNVALTKIKLNDTSEVSKIIEKSIQINDSINDTRGLALAYFAKAQLQIYRTDTSNAIINAKKAINLSEESLNTERLLETYSFLASIDNKNASDYAQKYINLNDSIVREERQARNKFARIRFETDEFIAENEQLEEQKEVLARQKQIWTALAVGFFLFGISVYIIINQRAKNQKLVFLQQQQANNQEVFNLMLTQKQKVDEVKRMEQKRISEELHDGVLGKMLGARMVLTGLNKKTGDEVIEARMEAIKALKNVEEEVRSISHELSHTAYQKINNFVNSITDLLASAKESSKITTTFNYDEDEDYDGLKGEIKINLYRMIQETLQNAIKHSGGNNFFVNFDRKDDTLIVEMGDDGKGFNLEKERKGIGMRNISSRVSKLNGKWFVDSEPNKGTKITLEIPLYFEESNTKNTLQHV